jgi:hypothetical protein
MSGALTALSANSPQDPYVWPARSIWIPTIQDHTAFATTQRAIPLSNLGGFLGEKVQVDINPKDLPDLLSNMHLKFSLKVKDSSNVAIQYTPQVGRAIISQVDFMIDGAVIESINDDWYIIRDELFLDADQKNSMYQATGVASSTNPGGDYIVPLEFFFCHRKKSPNPYLPTCAINAARISVVFYFNNQDWITNTNDSIDLIDPFLIIEGQFLSIDERLYYINTPMTYSIPIAYREALVTYKNGVAILHLTATFPVTMMVWFIRNSVYESGDPRYFASRYNYGYTTKYIHSSVPVTYFDGTTDNFIDVIQNVTMYFNGNNFLSNFPDGTYHSIVEPMSHNLSIPTKNVYMYCFTDNPKEYQIDGSINFAEFDYKTTHLDISFLPEYTGQVQNNFTLNLYYSGFQTLVIANGRAGFSRV